MGALLLSLFGSLGIISSGAGATASATTLSLEEIVITESIITDKWLSTIPEGVNLDIWLELTASENNLVAWLESQIAEVNGFVIEWLAALDNLAITETSVEGGILAGSLGTAAETLGISLAIGAAIYGGYYAYHHWDSIKNFASESLKTTEHYVLSAGNYLKGWWPF